MEYIKIPELVPYPLAAIQDDDLFEVAYLSGGTYFSRKVSGAAIKAASAGVTLWGLIEGDIDNQVDLIERLAEKFNNPTGTSAQYLDGTGTPITFPTIPAAQVNSDWNATSGVAVILNKPTSLPPSGPASGDLMDNYPNPTVSAIHNIDVQNGVPANGQVLQYTTSGSKWKHHTLTKSDVGLSNVDNTSDANKPISTATQNALDTKQDDITLTTNGTSGAATFAANVLNIPQYGGSGGSGFGYTLILGYTVTPLTASNTFVSGAFYGSQAVTLGNNRPSRWVLAPKSGRIVSASIISQLNAATYASPSSSVLTIRINNTTAGTSTIIDSAYPIGSSLSWSGNPPAKNNLYTLATPLVISAGDQIQIQIVTPAWSVAPSDITQQFVLFVE